MSQGNSKWIAFTYLFKLFIHYYFGNMQDSTKGSLCYPYRRSHHSNTAV